MNQLVQMINDLVGHLEFYLKKSVGFWMLVFMVYLMATIIKAEF